MNKFVKLSIIGFVLVVCVCIFVYLNIFVFGSKDYSSIVIDKVTIGSNDVTIKGYYTDSSRAYKNFSYKQVGNELYVTVISVAVSKKYSSGNFEFKVPVSGMNVNVIQLTDDKTTKVIYNKSVQF